ncbi:MAG: flagellar hook-basal body complex protein [Sulfuricurvum sp.]|nr:flagellar hook-basal body complex protein [Sulfuricurvum sp.]
MTQAYYTGISGLMANQTGMDIISENLSNVSTTGYKGSTAEFADIFSSSLKSASASSPTKNDIGIGEKLQATTTQLKNGSLAPSDRYTDLAIGGKGWFGVASGTNQFYTRDGTFSFDQYQSVSGDINSAASRLVTSDGKYVMGTTFNNFTYDSGFNYGDQSTTEATGAFVVNPTTVGTMASVNKQGILEFPTNLAYPAEPTTQANFFGNLGTDNQPRTISAQAVSANNQKNTVKLTFNMSATQPTQGIAWDVVATVTSNDGNTLYDTQTGQALFDANGALSSFTIPSVNNDGTPVALNLGTGYDGVISVGTVSVSGSSSSNGLASGTLTKYNIDTNGVITADFSNGRQSDIGQVAIYHFANDQGLERIAGTLFAKSQNSGDAKFWTDSTGAYTAGSTIYSGKLENSNVDYSVGLTDMIVTQRAYQANSKSITTVDEMIQKALQMHR